MIERKTVFVLGAGASAPFGFPLGRSLLIEIVLGLGSPGSRLNQVLRQLGIEQDGMTWFADELHNSAQASVDAFLEKRPDFLEIGKLAIAASLIPCEDDRRLMRRDDRASWYEYLFNRMGLTPENYAESPVSFVTFNYDRSLTRFLFVAFKRSFNLTEQEALKIVQHLEPIHVYGKLGDLQGIAGLSRPYSADPTPGRVHLAAKSIQIVSEEGDSGGLQKARELIVDAELVMFLGFGFHPTNVDRLQIPTRPGRRHVCGSAFGVANGERFGIQSQFPNKIHLGDRTLDALDYLRETPFLAWAGGADIGTLPS